jgi:phosphohistidine phosphatase
MTVSNIRGHARMKVFLLRHTEAAYGGPDPDRKLTEKGRRIAEQLAQHMSGNPFFDFSEIWVSPYLRARETAEPILKYCSQSLKVVVRDELVPHGEVKHLLNCLHRTDSSILLVGHNPLLANIGKTLMELPAQRSFPLKKGATMVFKRDAGKSTQYILAALLTPASLGIRA